MQGIPKLNKFIEEVSQRIEELNLTKVDGIDSNEEVNPTNLLTDLSLFEAFFHDYIEERRVEVVQEDTEEF